MVSPNCFTHIKKIALRDFLPLIFQIAGNKRDGIENVVMIYILMAEF